MGQQDCKRCAVMSAEGRALCQKHPLMSVGNSFLERGGRGCKNSRRDVRKSSVGCHVFANSPRSLSDPRRPKFRLSRPPPRHRARQRQTTRLVAQIHRPSWTCTWPAPHRCGMMMSTAVLRKLDIVCRIALACLKWAGG